MKCVMNLVVVLALASVSHSAHCGDTPRLTALSLSTAQTRIKTKVVSLYELRQSRLVRQTWDTSCGAAALSTLLTYHAGLSVSEYAIATSILRGADPMRVRQRGGFSLLDLKRFVEAIGMKGEGFGSMSVDDLENNNAPAIVPIRLRDLDHFVVFRNRIGDRVLLGDPAFGNVTLTVSDFEKVWRSRIAFYVHADSAQFAGGLDASALDLSVPDLAFVSRIVRSQTVAPAMRQLPLVARAK